MAVFSAQRVAQAVSQLPDVYGRMREERRKFPEASTFSFFWASVEDVILQACLDRAMEEPMPNGSSSSIAGALWCSGNVLCPPDSDCPI